MSRLPLDDCIDRIQAEFPAVTSTGYYNSGTIVPIPRSVLTAHQDRERRFNLGNPLDRGFNEDLRAQLATVRGKVASILMTEPRCVALMDNTTAGINAALLSLPWQPGDEILTSDAEHPAVLLPLAFLHRRYGVVIKPLPVTGGGLEPADVQAAITPAARAIVVSHVGFGTGGVTDAAAICALARRAGLTTVIDGAQAVGAIAADMSVMDPDFYAFPGYKWTMGPQGTAGMYVAPRILESELVPYRLGSHAVASRRGYDYTLHTDARRFEGTATTASLDFVTWGDSLDFGAGLGWLDVYARVAALCGRFRERLAILPGAELITPLARERSAALISFRLKGLDSDWVCDTLYERGLIIRTVPGGALRASFHFYHTVDQVDELLAGLRALGPGI